jgi:hypothetical protein
MDEIITALRSEIIRLRGELSERDGVPVFTCTEDEALAVMVQRAGELPGVVIRTSDTGGEWTLMGQRGWQQTYVMPGDWAGNPDNACAANGVTADGRSYHYSAHNGYVFDEPAITLVRAVQTSGASPSAWEGWDKQGRQWYLRYRTGIGEVFLVGAGTGPETTFEHGDRLAGVISLEDFARLAGIGLAEGVS